MQHRAMEPVHHSYPSFRRRAAAPQQEERRDGRPAHRREGSPSLLTREDPSAEMRTQRCQPPPKKPQTQKQTSRGYHLTGGLEKQ